MPQASADRTAALQAQVREAFDGHARLTIRGGDSKRFIGRRTTGFPLDTREHAGIVHYDPAELVLTARAGTPLLDIEAALDEKGQMLAHEPPHFSNAATFGGMAACGLSGPRRPWSGAMRDFTLGCRLIDGQARPLRFGGEVMKNVAGYDISRLMVGSFGCLGVLTEVSVKVLPRPKRRLTLRIEVDAADALRRLSGWAGKPLPISGACHDGTALYVRLEGGAGSLEGCARLLGGSEVDDTFWVELRELRLPFFLGMEPLWRLSVPMGIPPLNLPGQWILDWAGAQRWLRSTAEPATIRRAVEAVGGHAIAYRGHDEEPFHPLPASTLALHRRLKAQFDPRGILNPGRLYGDL